MALTKHGPVDKNTIGLNPEINVLICGIYCIYEIRRNTCKFSTIVVEKDEYKDGHQEPDQKPPVFSFLAACLDKGNKLM